MRSDSGYKLTIKVFTDVREEGNLLADVYRSGSPFEIITGGLKEHASVRLYFSDLKISPSYILFMVIT